MARKVVPIYVFRDPRFSRGANTVVSAAPRDQVVALFGGGGLDESEGLATVFGGVAVFHRARAIGAGDYHLAVWGARKAAKFRQSFRNAGMKVAIRRSPPPGRLKLKEVRARPHLKS